MNLKNCNSLEDITTYEDYFFDIIFSDPPYNLSSEWFIDDNGRYKLKRKQKDFLNKWDGLNEDDLDKFFKESFRTLKHGGYCVMFGMDRQLAPFQYYAVKNGFEIHQSLYWFYLTNFPKAADVSKAIDKKLGVKRPVVGKMQNHRTGEYDEFLNHHRSGDGMETGPGSELSKKYEGYKYGKAPLKQVMETIMVFHKPCKNKVIIDDIIEAGDSIHGSCLNIDGERVEYINREDETDVFKKQSKQNNNVSFFSDEKGTATYNNLGRHPSQLLTDKEGAEVIDKQTDIRPGGNYTSRSKNSNTYLKDYRAESENVGKKYPPGGGSKILHKCKYEEGEMDLLKYQQKVSKKERGDTPHPTMKPMELNRHILNLFRTPGTPRIYIPFSGVGSEIIPAIKLGYDVYSSELSEEYYELQQTRIKHWCE